MSHAPTLFDDPAEAAPASQEHSPGRVDFLAGLLSEWSLGAAGKPPEALRERFREIAREALDLAREAGSGY